MTTMVSRQSSIPFEHRKCLVLNRSWVPMRQISLIKAIHMVVSNRAKFVNPEDYQAHDWSGWSLLTPSNKEVIRTARSILRLPEIIVLNGYDKLPQPRKSFNRKTLFKRDHYRCMYCGCQPGAGELTIDHVVPRAQGGLTNWENCVLACIKCNAYKGNRTPEQAGMKLLKAPSVPTYKSLKNADMARVDSWCAFLGDSYWSVP